jgi:hypothetical protein
MCDDETTCVWIFDDETTGICMTKEENNNIKCFEEPYYNNEDMCTKTDIYKIKCEWEGTTCRTKCLNLNNDDNGTICTSRTDCAWLDSSSDENNLTGQCYSRDNIHECSEILRMSRCWSGANFTELSDKCGWYNGICKTLCSELENNNCMNDDRIDDCFLLTKNGSIPTIQCVNKV